ncbi:MAG: DNA/RNA helicase [Elusimicrobia bacterium CG_4_9_14_3_um_filter_62_55]|nr:MAG: DNA/RNA helicase [Elusimicrobia bacterium CG22_combo_CG10-13_8_21_14_all_63_91]PJA14313.1 MAG: DNA/RNA helicase [Elusimicrobia bacterium CG_4_10_14_0_2_um_filter_63_34]PJB26484.1 MAG: DNA/RNA helicase [Elusimicrobia bacterium CG_4_9_14_3_um_filter_62_55]
MTTEQDPRDIFTGRIAADLVGPGAPDESIEDIPSERYLSGILFPRASEHEAEDDEGLEDKAECDEQGASLEETARMALAGKPSTMGLSFAVREDGAKPEIKVRVRCGTYIGERKEGSKRGKPTWRRTAHDVGLVIPIQVGYSSRPVSEPQLPGLHLVTQISKASDHTTLTVALVNQNKQNATKFENERLFFFQVELAIIAAHECALVARPRFRTVQDEEDESNALLYREHREFAVGHTCSASWTASGDTASLIQSTWLPRHIVNSISSAGDPVFGSLGDATSPEWLAAAAPEALAEALGRLPATYRSWLQGQMGRVDGLPASLREAARRNLASCDRAAKRIEEGVALIAGNATVRKAFQLANHAIHLQRHWQGDSQFRWRPFQLGFQLLCVASLADGKHADRRMMDLLWFPTGGGKTEAYLALTAFTLIIRRLTEKDDDRAAGVSVLMRYTLRLLTIQQFQRAAALILACEHLRKQDKSLGNTPFSIGLWVGGGATPNTDADARKDRRAVMQLNKCPACSTALKLEDDRVQRVLRPACQNAQCVITGLLPIYTVDEYIYKVRPSLVIGTLDKFAQIVRKPETSTLFGKKGGGRPPDMIIQDELHLISGPLGTLAGLYEVAIDAICSRDGYRPKVIGSTATIRRAAEQIKDLFDRDAHQFPPPCIDVENSCFAVVDHGAPGRLYLGLSTAGRSARFSLQAVCASSLQAANDPRLPEALRNYYSTLVAYFNTLRELGGALVLMQDDVGVSLRSYSARRGEAPRSLIPPLELTSRTPSVEIPTILETLQEPGQCDILLASNMISVGVDIPRLGLMVVNGQPKGIAEYIQATSRVGRNLVPGIILTVFNHARARDRSRFETFSSWHATLYRDVESTSVTPFAPRARDKALHAVLVALVRHLQPTMTDSPVMNAARRQEVEVIARVIIERARRVDPDESASVLQRVMQLLDGWAARKDLRHYWDDSNKAPSLLISAEAAAALGKDYDRLEWPTPNSMREVEPGTPFVITERLREDISGTKSN